MIIDDVKFKQIIRSRDTKNYDLETLYFMNCGPNVPGQFIPKFTKATTVYFKNNDNDFNFYWISTIVFPNIKNIYFSGNTNESYVYLRFPIDTWTIEQGSSFFPGPFKTLSSKEFDLRLPPKGYYERLKSYLTSWVPWPYGS